MNHCIPIQLDELVHVRVSGDDAVDFLQGQLSNDLRLLGRERAQLSSYNSAKGRMLAVLHMLRTGDDAIFLEMHRDVAEATIRRLRMFVLRAKVTIEDVSTQWHSFGVLGTNAAANLAALDLKVPDAPLACTHDPARGVSIMRRLGEQPRYSLHGTPGALAELASRLGPAHAFSGWRLADIEAGVPVVFATTSDHFIPQMANLDLLGGISFDKGCYTGQEIVARLHYLGQLKRRLFVLGVDGPPPAPGDEIVGADGTSSAGEVVDAVAVAGISLISAVVQLSQVQAGTLQLGDGRGLRIRRAAPA